jgi:sulfonate dioxygenase
VLPPSSTLCRWNPADPCKAHNPPRTHSDPALPLYDITDRGHFADPDHARLRAFVEARGGKIKDVKLEELGEAERDDL